MTVIQRSSRSVLSSYFTGIDLQSLIDNLTIAISQSPHVRTLRTDEKNAEDREGTDADLRVELITGYAGGLSRSKAQIA